MKKLELVIVLILFLLKGNAQEVNDTIKIVIDLNKVDSLGLKINVYPPNDLHGNVKYQFPKTIPGTYEYLNNTESFIKLSEQNKKLNSENYSYKININQKKNRIDYTAKSSIKKYKSIYAEDTYFVKDSVYILNWHYLLGFFQAETDRPYKIEIIKDKKLYGSGSLSKTFYNDTIDIYTANNYKELIHNPIMYSIPDTTSFMIDNTKFNIACAGHNSKYTAEKIKNLIIKPLSWICKESEFKHKEYSFLYFFQYSLNTPYLEALEHSKSTLICCHSALLDDNILISSSIHEFIHSLFAPLRIRSEVISDFNFVTPKCDEYLWFYEGITEYFAIKTLTNSGFYNRKNFIDELYESNKHYKNINFAKVSSNIYKKKENKLLFDNFYTKGSLFAAQLDMELIKRSNGKINLFDVMKKLQTLYSPEKAFIPESFIAEFSRISGCGIEKYIIDNTEKNRKIDFDNLINDFGYKKEFKDTTIWTYNIKKNYIILNYKKNRLEIAVFGSKINKELNAKKVTIYEVDGEPLTWFNYDKILSPKGDKELSFKAYTKSGQIDFNSRPEQILKEKKNIEWVTTDKIYTENAQYFWKE